jgi:nucleotide-binding universal stress UspA family protein
MTTTDTPLTATAATSTTAAPASLRIGNVVVGDDGSPTSRAALRWAVTHVSGDVEVVRALSPGLELLESGFQIDTSRQVERAWRDVAWAIGELGDDAERAHARVIEDEAPLALLDAAHRLGADAIVVGSNGHARFGDLVGANLGRLLHLGDVPVVVIPEPRARPVDDGGRGPIVVGVGGGPDDERHLLDWVARTAPGRAVTLLHAISPAALAIVGDSAVRLQHSAARHLDALADGRFETSIVVEHPLDALVSASANASMVVVGSHRSTRTAGFLIGSIAQHLPALAACPVAVVPIDAAR